MRLQFRSKASNLRWLYASPPFIRFQGIYIYITSFQSSSS
nr:MAG TPA: hypothetical protein [Bacteriophage sp.]